MVQYVKFLIQSTLLTLSVIPGSNMSLLDQILSEFSECHVNIILNTNIVQNKGVDMSPFSPSVPVALMALGMEMDRVMKKFKQFKLSRRRPCELVLSNWTTSESHYADVLTNKFKWLTECGFLISAPIGYEPLCLSKVVYFIFIRSAESREHLPSNTLYSEPLFEITWNRNNTLIIRALPVSHFCYSSSVTDFNLTKYEDIYIRGYLRDVQWTLFESQCKWNVGGVGVGLIENFTFVFNTDNVGIYDEKILNLVHDLFHPRLSAGISSDTQIDRIVNGVTRLGLNMPSSVHNDYYYSDSYSTLKKQTHFNFVTCHQDFYISILSFVNPFQYNLWGGVVGTIALSIFCLKLYVKRFTLSMNPIFLITRILFEQGVSELTQTKLPILRGFCLLHCVTCFLISNAYRGKLTTDLTAPPRPYQMKTTEEALEREFRVLMRYEVGVPYFKEKLVLRDKIIELSITYGWILYFSSLNRAIKENKQIAKRYNSTFHKISSHHFIFKGSDVMNSFVDTEFDLCNETILIGETLDLAQFSFQAYKRNPNRNIYYGQDTILGTNLNLQLISTFWDKSELLKHRFGSLITSGIFDNQFMNNVKRDLQHKTELSPMKIKSNIAVLFIIHIILTVLSLHVFFAEKFVFAGKGARVTHLGIRQQHNITLF